MGWCRLVGRSSWRAPLAWIVSAPSGAARVLWARSLVLVPPCPLAGRLGACGGAARSLISREPVARIDRRGDSGGVRVVDAAVTPEGPRKLVRHCCEVSSQQRPADLAAVHPAGNYKTYIYVR